MSKLTLCKAFVANLLCLLTPLTGSAAFYCSDLFTVEATREKAPVVVDWNNDISVLDSKQRMARYGKVATFFSKKWDTQVYHSNTGIPNAKGELPLVDPSAKAVFMFFHGSGTMKSSGSNFVGVMNSLSNLGYSSIAVDNPFHKQGPRDTKYMNPEVADILYYKWVREIVKEVKKAGIPVYIAGHSHGAGVSFEYVHRYPHDLTGSIPLSPAAFNEVLADWNNRFTANMTFGDIVHNVRGDKWAETVDAKNRWAKDGAKDPTLANKKLVVRGLAGNMEEYVPGPVGGPNGTPTGPNTYDISVPIKESMARAIFTIEPGVGHYIFDHLDKDGYNIVMRELLMAAGEHPKNIEAMTQARKTEIANMHISDLLAHKYATDELFKLWADATYGPAKVLQIAAKERDAFIEKIASDYYYAMRERDMVIFQKIINSKTTDPEFYEKYKSHIDKYTPKKLDTALFNPWLAYLTGKNKTSSED